MLTSYSGLTSSQVIDLVRDTTLGLSYTDTHKSKVDVSWSVLALTIIQNIINHDSFRIEKKLEQYSSVISGCILSFGSDFLFRNFASLRKEFFEKCGKQTETKVFPVPRFGICHCELTINFAHVNVFNKHCSILLIHPSINHRRLEHT